MNNNKKYDKGYVYFIYSKDELLYVGKTNNLKNRLTSHKVLTREWDKGIFFYKFREDVVSKVEYVEVEDNLSKIELKFIGFFKPKYNIAGKKRDSDININDFKINIFNLDENHFVKYDLNTRLEIENDIEYMQYYNNVIVRDVYDWFKYNITSRYNAVDCLLDLVKDKYCWIKNQKDVMLTLCVLRKYKLIEMSNTSKNVISIKIKHHINYMNEVKELKSNINKIENINKSKDNVDSISSTDFKCGDIVIHKSFGEGIIYKIEGLSLAIGFENFGIKRFMIDNISNYITKK